MTVQEKVDLFNRLCNEANDADKSAEELFEYAHASAEGEDFDGEPDFYQAGLDELDRRDRLRKEVAELLVNLINEAATNRHVIKINYLPNWAC